MPELYELQLLTNQEGKGIRIIETVAPDWQTVAALLGFNVPRIRTIRKDGFYQQEEACFNMFERWLDGEHNLKPPRWFFLIQCLENSRKFDGLTQDLKKIIMLQEGILYKKIINVMTCMTLNMYMHCVFLFYR